MRLRPCLRAFLRAGQSAALASLIAAASGACGNEFDTTRRASEPLTLGDDLFQVLCDRVAATADPFDLEARKSRVVCHPDGEGKYGDDYSEADRPMPAKVAVMVRYRPRLIEAFNATFPDKDSLQSDLKDLMAAMVPLYDDDTLPESTRTLAALFDVISFDQTKPPPDESPVDATIRKARLARAQEVRAALARLGGRKGYRTVSTAIGVARPLLAYKDLHKVVASTIRLLGPGGTAEEQIRKLLEITQYELAKTEIAPPRSGITGYKDRFSGVAAQKPKLTSEILANLLVDAPPLKADLSGPGYPATWADAYAADGIGGVMPTVPFLVRDLRGFAAFATKPANARDKDGDGLVDIDTEGRFLAVDGKPLDVLTPFAYVTADGIEAGKGPRDALGRALVSAGGSTLYEYGDASKTMLHAVLVDTQTLAAPSNGALLDLAHGAVYQLGARVDATETYDDPDGSAKKFPVSFKKFDAKTAPLADLVYAFGRVLELPRIADYVELQRQLMRDHPAALARIVGAALSIREIANKPEYKDINLDPKSPLWDEVIKIVGEMAAEPDVMRDVLDSFADPRVLLLPNGMARFAAHSDALDYNPSADSCWAMGSKPDAKCPQLNDPWWNVTQGGVKKDPARKVDWSKPDDENNRSLFQRFLSLINDSYLVRSCNKEGGKISTKLGPIPFTLPIFGTYSECEVLDVPDLAVFYLGCIAGGNIEGTSTPRCKLPVTDGFVKALNSIGLSGMLDSTLESSSGITGLKQTPTVEALNRMVMWRNPNKFVTDLMEPMTTNVCPIGSSKGTRKCASPDDLLANRQRATIFMGEAYDAVKGLAPTLTPFVKKRGDGKGREQYFIRLVQTFHRHWSVGKNPVRCADGGTPESNPKFCYKTNVRQFEPILAEAFATDIVPALHELTKVVRGLSVNGKSGNEVMAALMRDLTDPKVAAAMKLTDREGSASTTQNDGKAVPQLTYFHLFANAVNAFDTRWAGEKGPADHELWRAARGKLVDQFLAVEAPDGDKTKSRFKNPGVRTAGPILMDLIDDRIAEHKAKGDLADWAKSGLYKSFVESIESPIFAAAMDLQEKIYADPEARKQLGELLVYLANQASANDALASVLTATQDILQLVGDEVDMVPIYHAAALAAAPDGTLKRSLDL
ncbi:MAG: hypothetical protein HYV09_14635, partial [Deltaproteobacteria bacterium]|nr:hypothetical protein [Deltaproteobacteria bacterium]